MGVIFEAADDVSELLVPFLRAEGSTSPIDAVQDTYLQASLGQVSAAQLWRALVPGGRSADDLNARYLAGHSVRPDAIALISAASDRQLQIACVSNDVSEWSFALRTGFGFEQSQARPTDL
ncbi:MAG: hypothetical protein O2822_06090 [Chloroflexi bacterium]|nr:hypothetical protein [Chloroflexota bacterium]